jgi:archaellum component FlaG (FlaF/FlaG flagellin family)
MNNSHADMIVVDMRIIGDPDWIPQDSSIRGGEISVGDITTKLDNWGSIAVDVAGVYAKLQLRNPIDYNDNNGLMNLTEDKSLVGGVYQIITVENLFEGGKYTCNLKMNKIPNQTENRKPTTNTNTSGTNVAREVNAGAGVINNPAVNISQSETTE